MDVFAYGAFEDFEDGFFGHGWVGFVWCVNFILPSFDNVSMVTAGELRYVRNIKVLLSAMMIQLDVLFCLL